jgi:hypothetical protein
VSLVLFEGPAGTGKTTSLLAALRERLAVAPLASDQRVLALTKLHGSRRRMDAKLRSRSGVGRVVDCVTIDSFAWRLVRRWRGLVRHIGAAPEQGDYRSITSAAGLLLQRPNVATWISRRYPVIAVDEMQDCTGGEVQLLAGLILYAYLICAADEFQDLSGAPDCEAVAWARAAGEVVSLDHNHRTDVEGLLRAASALREGKHLLSDRNRGFEIAASPKAAVAGGRLSWRIKLWASSGSIAIISPTKPGTSPFVDSVLGWVAAKAARSKKPGVTAGPFRIPWESADDQVRTQIESALALPSDPDTRLEGARLGELGQRIGAADLCMWLERERTLAGRDTVTTGEVRAQIAHLVHRRRAFGRTREQSHLALTVHQAKNREFDSVIVLWPLKVQPDPEQQRRLLYNGVTRAKKHALVIVEDPKGDRLSMPPFRTS